MFFAKQYGFQVNNSTHHANLNLNDDILTSFEKGPKQNIIYFILQEKEKIYQIHILPLLHIDYFPIKREFVTKFLGVYLDENISWKCFHIN